MAVPLSRAFRKYHRQIAIAAAIPLIVTVITGMAYTIADEWFGQGQLGGLLLSIHTMEIIKLGKIYPILNGIGLIGLLVTGLSMSSLFKKRPERNETGDR